MQYYQQPQQPYQQNNQQSKQNPFALSAVQILLLLLLFILSPTVYFWMATSNGGKIFNMNRDYTIHLYNQKEKLENKLKNLQSNKSQLDMINMVQNK
ncbi:hypothetical protein [Candidatus Phytoplasma pruni]|uniref:Uncharacterized protein n=1 Tax=Candidatus Phytoplasma pruni TaxID=479893 RepID=A0A851HBZ0_9MOLU|nr:hypothetical protein [Candidatus Phytoplasma pruni]NWN45541.1 hypothetical protein [Candidatus Phytoplasma pruni]